MTDNLKSWRVNAVLIDLDGTLLHTVPDLAMAVNAMRADLGLAPLPDPVIATYVGKGAESLMHRALSESLDGRVDEATFQRGYERFLHHYEACNGRAAVVYPGVREGLAAFQAMGLRLACVTNKPARFTHPLLDAAGLLDAFELVVSGDTLARKKPDPLPMTHACQFFGLPADRVVAIGDSINDVLAARAAGCLSFVVPYGYNEGQDVQGLDADAIVQTLLEAASRVRLTDA